MKHAALVNQSLQPHVPAALADYLAVTKGVANDELPQAILCGEKRRKEEKRGQAQLLSHKEGR
jgi:hypothetical protein